MRAVANVPSTATVAEIAKALKVKPLTIYRMIQRGELEAIRIGGPTGRLRVDRRELERYLSARRSVALRASDSPPSPPSGAHRQVTAERDHAQAPCRCLAPR